MKLKFAFSLYLLLSFSLNLFASGGITDSPHRGRFGDCLLSYMGTKWLSYKKNIQFFYYPFAYSDSLMISKLESKYTADIKKSFAKVIQLRKNNFSSLGSNNSTLYITNYYLNLDYADIDFNEEKFIKELKKTIAPIIEIQKHHLPVDRISVAVHVRKGGGFDKPLLSESHSTLTDVRGKQHDYVDVGYPLKFPPDDFYIKQLKFLYHKLDKPLFVYIFTDDKNPSRIVERYKQDLCDLDITFSCRDSGNKHNANVLEDFFAMNQYDCLIRSASNFSYCADIIGDFFISIYPEHGFWKSGKLIMDDIRVKVNPKSFCKIARFFEDDSFLNTLLKEPNVRTKM